MEDLKLLQDRIAHLLGEIAKNDLFGGIPEDRLDRMKQNLVEMKELESELMIELGLKPRPTCDKQVTKLTPRFKNTFRFNPFQHETINPNIVYLGYAPDAEITPDTLLPSVYIGCNTDNISKAIAYLLKYYPELAIERRVGSRTVSELELKLSNCTQRQLDEFIGIDWENLEECKIPVIASQIYYYQDGVVVTGDEKTDFAAIFSFSNKSVLKKWLNFLKRGRSISGESAFINGCVIEAKYHIGEEERLVKKGEHQLIVIGLSLAQVESILQFDFTSPPDLIDDHFFDYGHELSESEQTEMQDFMALQSNY